MISSGVKLIAAVLAGAFFVTGHVLFGAISSAILVIALIEVARRRACLLNALTLSGPKNLVASEGRLFFKLKELDEIRRTLEWERDISNQVTRPLEDHPLLRELAQPTELRKFSDTELLQRILTVVAGFTRAQAAGVIARKLNKNLVVAYGVTGKRFEQHLEMLGEQLWTGHQGIIGIHDAFDRDSIWGGAGSFGHRFSLALPIVIEETSPPALVWLGYAHGSKPSQVELETARQILDAVSKALLSVKRLAVLDSRAQTAEVEKTQTSQMLAQVSHDIRSPLANVKSILHLLKQPKDIESGELSELINVALENCDELGELVSDVIDFTRAKSGQLVARKELIDLSDICSRVVSAFSVSAKQKGIRLTFSTAAECWVSGDGGHLKRAITNLVGNGLKFTPSGEVRITLEKRQSDNSAVITVSDTGLGMTADQVSKLFTPYTRFHAQHAEGIGLGLAITKLFVEEHGGSILVESQVNSGTKFIIKLPIQFALNREFTSTHKALNLRETSGRVLLVDDDIDVANSLARLLRLQGFTVQTADSVRSASLSVSAERFDAVITDLAMPNGGGLAVLEAAQASCHAPAVYILSGDFDSATVSMLKARGAVDVFEKPVDFSILSAALKSSLATTDNKTNLAI